MSGRASQHTCWGIAGMCHGFGVRAVHGWSGGRVFPWLVGSVSPPGRASCHVQAIHVPAFGRISLAVCAMTTQTPGVELGGYTQVSGDSCGDSGWVSVPPGSGSSKSSGLRLFSNLRRRFSSWRAWRTLSFWRLAPRYARARLPISTDPGGHRLGRSHPGQRRRVEVLVPGPC